MASLVRGVQRTVMRALLAITPKFTSVVVNGYPDNEGNALEMLRALACRYPGRIYWLVARPAQALQILRDAEIDPDQRVMVLAHRSAHAMWRFATAEVVMFTHGIYGNPRPVRRKTFVNLWHGGGFKRGIMADERGRPTIHSQYLVASSRQLGRKLASECRLPEGGLLLTGNPRIDQFSRSGAAMLTRLGIPSDRPVVMWMPTFRRNAGHGLTGGWTDVAGGADDAVNRAAAAGVGILVREFGFTIVVKPHPVDAENRSVEGASVVTNDDLAAAGVQLYELIGTSSALLTDYSSVWIDYLVLDRPVGFVVPDELNYAEGRGFDPPDALDWLPGPQLRTDDDFRAFGEDVATGGDASRARRTEVADHIGHIAVEGVADQLLTDLAERRVFLEPLITHPSAAPTN